MNSFVKKIKETPDALFGKGVSEESIIIAEAKLKLRFAEEYKEYLRSLSVMELYGREFTGLSESKRVDVVNVTTQQREITPDVPSDWYVIEEANIDGILVWQNTVGYIFQTAPNAKTIKVADSFEEYVFMRELRKDKDLTQDNLMPETHFDDSKHNLDKESAEGL